MGSMKYKEKIDKLIMNIDSDIVDFSLPRKRPSMPTQISSEFLTNKEQGDWAEQTLIEGINVNSDNVIAVRYGKSDNIVAGENDFKNFFEEYQNELDIIGKRPDLLLFNKKDFPYKERDISNWTLEQLDRIVPKALCGIEVRSSAFLIDKYENYMSNKILDATQNALIIKNKILNNYGELLKEKNESLYKIIQDINPENMSIISFRCSSWSSSKELKELSTLIKELKENLEEVTKRTFLSITPKVEDLKVVYTWISRYNVPHYYVQVFFDKAYGISFEKILEYIGNPKLEDVEYFIESDIKNQGKTTIKIHATKQELILNKIYLPTHHSEMKELDKGRLLFYVKFNDSVSSISESGFQRLFKIKL